MVVLPEGVSQGEAMSVSLLFMNSRTRVLAPAFNPNPSFQQLGDPNLSDLPPVIHLKRVSQHQNPVCHAFLYHPSQQAI